MKIIIFDVETTGLPKPSLVPLDKQPYIIEFGALRVVNGKVTKKFNQLIDPGCKLPEKITKITGITDADLVGQPSFEVVLPDIIKLFRGADILIAHNAPFDTSLLKFELQRLEYTKFPWPKQIICTVQEYRTLIGKWPKLTELYANIMGKELAQTHRALDDCIALHEILAKDKFYERIV